MMKEVEMKANSITPEAIEARKDLFDNVMKNIKIIETDENIGLSIGSISMPLSLCYVDTQYQRERTEKEIDNMEKNWNPSFVGTILLVPHPEENRFAIVDGQKRVLTAPRFGKKYLPASIAMKDFANEQERLEFEAGLFIAQDLQIDKVKTIQKHPARLLLNDPGAVTLQFLLNKYNIDYVESKGQRAKAVLGSYSETYTIANREDGFDCLDFIFGIIENAAWNEEENGYATYIMRALRGIYVAHEDMRTEVHKFLSDELRQVDPEKFKSYAVVRYPKRDYKSACTLYTEDIVCEHFGIEKRIYLQNDKLVNKK